MDWNWINLLTWFGYGDMIAIVICSIFALAYSLDRFYHFSRIKTDSRHLLQDIKELLRDSQMYQAMARCDETSGPVAAVCKTVIKNIDKDKETITDAVEATALYEIPRLQKHLNKLATLANISPLLGLLGTVVGMVVCFQRIEAQQGPVNAHVLANGIWIALVSTVQGLTVAIPTIVVYNYFTSRVNKISVEMERITTELLHFIEHQRNESRGRRS